MKKMLILSIDSESYTLLEKNTCILKDESIKEARKVIGNILAKGSGRKEEPCISIEPSNGSYDVTLEYEDGYFIVAKAIPFPEKKYAIVFWQAYGDVQFEIKAEMNNKDIAIKMLNNYVEKDYIGHEEYSLFDYKKGNDFMLADEEGSGIFHMLEVINLKEVA